MNRTEFEMKYALLRSTADAMYTHGELDQGNALMRKARELKEQFEADEYTDYTMRLGERGIGGNGQ